MKKYIILLTNIIFFNISVFSQCKVNFYQPTLVPGGPFDMVLDASGCSTYNFTPTGIGQWQITGSCAPMPNPVQFYSATGPTTLKYCPSTMTFTIVEPVPSFCAKSSTNGFLNNGPPMNAEPCAGPNAYCFTGPAAPGNVTFRPIVCGGATSSGINYAWDISGTGKRIANSGPSNSVVITTTKANQKICMTYIPSTGNIVPGAFLYPEAVATPTHTTCGLNNGSISVNLLGTYAWTGGLSGQNPTNVAPGTYSVTVTTSPGCTFTASTTINGSASPPAANAGADVFLNCNTPSTILTATGGGTYAWNNGATQGGSITPLATTTYTVTTTAANGCTSTDAVVVNVDKTPPPANAGADVTINCTTTSTTLSATGGGTYTWNNSATQNGTVMPSSNTTYSVTVTGTNGCTASDDVTVTVDSTIPIVDAGADVTLNCANLNTVLNATGTPNGTFSWNSGAQGATVTPTATTTYTVTITLPNGCTATDAKTVTVDSTIPTVDAGADVTLDCANLNTVLNATGTPNGTFSWNSGAQGATVTPTATTTYTVTITLPNGCTATDAKTVTVDNTIPTVDAGADVTLDCANLNTVLNATGTPNGTFSWNSGAQGATVTPTATTTYTVTITLPNGCTATDAKTVTVDNTIPTVDAGADVTLDCANLNTVLNATGTPNGTFSWNSGAQGATVTPTATTTYTVTITLPNGCTATDAKTVTVDNTIPTVDAGADVTLDCANLNTVLNATGTPNGTFSWNSGAQGATVTPTATTTYTVTITLPNGCTATDAKTVTVDNTIPTVDAGADVTLDCANLNTVLNATGTPNGTFSWNSGAQGATVTPTATTTYTVTITLPNGCTATDAKTVTVDSTIPIVDAGADVTLDCANLNTVLNATGTPNGTFSWNSGTQGATVTPTATTTYTVTITLPNGCTATDAKTVTVDNTIPTVDAGADVTLDCANLNTVLNATGTPNGTFSWNSGAQGATVTPTATTTYTVTITLPNGCTATDAKTVTVDSTIPTVDAGADVTLDCANLNTVLNATGTPNGTFSWNSGAQGATVTPTATTTYTVTITLPNGCTATDAKTVTVDSTIPTVDAGADVTLDCANLNTVLNATGTPNGTFSWNSGTQGATVTPTATTTYTVTITLPNGCTATDAKTVTVDSTIPIVDAGADVTLNCANLNTVLNATGTPNGTFSWNSGAQGATVTPTATTTYTVTITLPNGCTATDAKTVTVDSTIPTVDAGADVTLDCANLNTVLNATGTPNGTFSWNSGAQGATVTPTATTTYTVTITLPNGCTATDAKTVTVDNTIPTVDAGADVTLDCANLNTVLNATGTPNGTFSWNSGAQGATVTPTATTTYTVTITLPNGCTATDAKTVTVDSTIPTVDAGADVTLNCANLNTVLNATGTPNGTFSWNSGTQGATVTPTATTTYTVTITLPNGCTATDAKTVTVDSTIPIVDAGADVTLNCANLNTVLNATGTPNGTFSWNSGAQGATVTPTATTTYTVTITLPNGCTATDAKTVTVDSTIPTVDAGADVTLDCNTTSTILSATGGGTYAWNNGATQGGSVTPPVTTTYIVTVTAANGCTAIGNVTITVITPITTTFTQILPICINSIAPILPTNSTNIPSITGTWNPATINTSAVGISTYTFIPNANECATIFNMNIDIKNSVTPTFTITNPLCLGATAPILPNISNNAINGSWNPSIISTATAGTTTYTFTPNVSECAVSLPIDITISSSIAPTFTSIAPICVGSTAPILATTSNNNIVGSWTPNTVNTTTVGTNTYTFMPNSGQCSVDFPMDITISNNVTPTFTQLGPYCIGDNPNALPNISNNSVNGTWNPATISTLTAGTQIYTFTPDAGQCAVVKTMSINVNTATTTTFSTIKNSYCVNETANNLPTSSSNAIVGTWNPSTISTTTAGFTNYTFTPNIGQCATSVPLTVSVSAPVTPIFPDFGPYCLNSPTITLPSASNNIPPINGGWSPTSVNTAIPGTNTYTFTPNANECASIKTTNIEVGTGVSPTFPTFGPYCIGSATITLPLTSDNGIQGTWDISSVNTASAGTVPYTFTPDVGQCGTPKTINITVGAPQNTVFADVKNTYCLGATPDALPLSDDTGISGSWSPALVNTATVGNSIYTFTPNSGICANAFILQVDIKAIVVPTPTAVGPFCQNQILSIANSALPNTVGTITGTWSPSIVSTATTGTSVYTFLPNDPTQCAASTTLNVITNPNITPTFIAIPDVCQGSTAPILPNVSQNNVSGTWSPAIISTTNTGSTIYTFTPSVGECATNVTLSVNVTATIVPTFSSINPICMGSIAPVLITTSFNAIAGTWNPTAINTSVVGSFNYTFTPNSSAQCASSTIISVTIKDKTTPTFASIDVCEGTTPPNLPNTSQNSISGAWTPAAINSSVVGTYTFNFTPNLGQCANNNGQITVNITAAPTPVFPQLGPFCLNAIPPTLPSTTTSGIFGTWTPATIDTKKIGKTDYVFTPALNQCAKSTKMTIEVGSLVLPVFDPVGPLCVNSVAPTLPGTSKNNIQGTWNPATINTLNKSTQSFTFTPNAGQCGDITTMNVVVSDPVVTTFDPIGIICEGSVAPVLSLVSKEGIKGAWNPTTINTNIVGTTTYTFTPSSNTCAKDATLDITIDTIKTPDFEVINPLCINSTPPILATNSKNGIKGSWSPTTIKTNIAGTFSFVFTPDAGICAKTLTIKVVVDAAVSPIFSIKNLCIGDVLTLPLVSDNSVNGAWNTPTVNTTLAGTTSYTFTPNTNECALAKTLNITVNTSIKPIFDKINPYCVGATATALPLTSKNGVKGTWSPAIVDTKKAEKTAYVFTPNAGLCADTASLIIEVKAPVTADFNSFGPYCINAPQVTLPTTGKNGIKGTWSPAVVTTASASNNIYTFTPNPNQCAVNSTAQIEVTTAVKSTFLVKNNYCQNAIADVLATTSANNVKGVWNPMTISTASIGTKTYTFTPSAGECGTSTTLDVTINENILPDFDAILPICQDAIAPILPLISKNNIEGTWLPAIVDSKTVGTTTYTFTPKIGICAKTTTLNITIKPTLIPDFAQIAPYCEGETPILLANKDKNNLTGTWNPSTINTKKIGKTIYTFTPTAGQCAVNQSLDVTVNAKQTPIFTLKKDYCEDDLVEILPIKSDNNLTGTWNPTAISNTTIGNTTYTFTPNTNECTVPTTQNIFINKKILPDFDFKNTYCQGETAQNLTKIAKNNVKGTWNPTTIDVNTIGDATYTFTPDAGECAKPYSFDVKIKPNITPAFTLKNEYCIGSKAEILPKISTNNLIGTWNITQISTAKAGTTKYTFTPNAGQCATQSDLNVLVNAKILPEFIDLGPYCKGKKADTLSTKSLDGVEGTWSPSIINTNLQGETIYTFTPAANECAFSQTIKIDVVKKPTIEAVATKTRVCPGDSTILTVNGAPIGSLISWDNGEKGNSVVATPLKSGIYNVSVTLGSDCVSSAYVYVSSECEEDFFAPTSFSPNGDNINDNFTIFGGKNIKEILSLKIYDRWGEVIFENKNFQPNKEDNGWNGAFRGADAISGVYIYFAEIKFKDGKVGKFKGEVFLYK